MTSTTVTTNTGLVDRRKNPSGTPPGGVERRQFSNSHTDLEPQVQELAYAIDEYKLRHRRRFISYEEIYGVIRELGYHKD